MIWAGLNTEFPEGKILKGNEIGRMLKILDRKISNYYRSPGSRPIQQPSRSYFEENDMNNIKLTLAVPSEELFQTEVSDLINEKLSELPSHIAEAVRARFSFPGAPKWAEYVQSSGTTRQNITKLVDRALKKLKRVLPDSLRE
jgi:hypothetical protein